jgi:hypothetical protein
MNWLTETFSSTSSDDDLVKSRSLNTTRMAAVVAPVLAGIATAVGELADQPPFDKAGFQRQLILALVGMIAVVSVADIIGRAVASSRAGVPVATLFPSPVKASKDVPDERDIDGHVVAFRSLNVGGSAVEAEFLFVGPDGASSWETGAGINLAT